MSKKRRTKTVPLPSKREILDFIHESPDRVGKREIARAFRIGGADRVHLKAMLKEMREEGLIERGRGRRLRPPGTLPRVAVIEVTGTDPDGELLARPLTWRAEEEPPRIYLAPERRGKPALGIGDRVLAGLHRTPEGVYEARPIRVITGTPRRVLGVYALGRDGGRVHPTDRRAKSDLQVARGDANGARPGDLVLAEVLPGKRLGLRQARVIERLGHTGEPRSISLVAIHTHGVPTDFTAEALARAGAAEPVGLEDDREDLRDVPLVTIDGEDARDFDDAVWAEPVGKRGKPEGWHLIVAIADVAHYVRPGDALDRAAFERGNSVYFPDRVVPMLPEALSNDLCSLRPGEDRACLACHLWIDDEGNKRRHKFVRGLMRSAARLTYTQVQGAADGRPDDVTRPLLDPVIRPLFGAYAALRRARERRGTLDLDLPERKVEFDGKGNIVGIEPAPRYVSHRLIEEFMIAANVAAAETVERTRQPCMYRVHDRPDPVKVDAVRDFLARLGLSLPKGQVLQARQFDRLLKRAAETPNSELVNQLVLRSQAQAAYGPENIGHFGLALRRYSHFTSPIRRYADILVHRALIAGLGLGTGGLDRDSGARFAEIGEHISVTERRGVAAERDAMDRYTTAFLADRVGAVFRGRITGVTRFGLFVTLEESGADGLIPIRTLPPPDYYVHDEARHSLVGRQTGEIYTLGDLVEVRLAEADVVTGGLVLELIDVLAHAPRPRKTASARRPPKAAARAGRKRASRRKAPPRRGRK